MFKYLIILSTLTLVSFPQQIQAEQVFIIDDLSDKYYVKILLDNMEDADSAKSDKCCQIAIYQKSTHKQLLQVNSTYENLEYLNSIVQPTNNTELIKKIPYANQNTIVYKDFNFDGIKDFALDIGNSGWRNSHAYEIYLADGKGFNYSEEFTDLNNNYASFSVDYDNQRLYTESMDTFMYEKTEYKVVNNKPVMTKMNGEYLSTYGFIKNYSEINVTNDKISKKEYTLFEQSALDENSDGEIFSFSLRNNKKMRLIAYGEYLFYLYTDANEQVELYYLEQFSYDKAKKILNFNIENTQYYITANKISINTNGKKYVMHAVPHTIKGNFLNILKYNFSNINIK